MPVAGDYSLNMTKFASTAQKSFISSLCIQIARIDPTYEYYMHADYIVRQATQNWTRGMTAGYASLCIDGLKNRLEAAKTKDYVK